MSYNTLNNKIQYLIQYFYKILLRHMINNTNQHCAFKTDIYNILFYRTILYNRYIKKNIYCTYQSTLYILSSIATGIAMARTKLQMAVIGHCTRCNFNLKWHYMDVT
jgi:hypothetical protein